MSGISLIKKPTNIDLFIKNKLSMHSCVILGLVSFSQIVIVLVKVCVY